MAIQARAQAPERVRFLVQNPEAASEPLDLSGVLSVSLEVTEPNGQRVVWSSTVLSQNADELIVEHVFSINDVFEPGTYRIDVSMVVSGGVRRAGPTALLVNR